MSDARASVAIAIPAYNEEGIAGFLRDIDQTFITIGRRTSIHVVDDRSTDDTHQRVLALSGELSAALDVTTNERNMGHGPTALAAYRRALDSGADYVVQVDGDGQFEATDLERLVLELDVGADVAVGVRRNRVDPWFRRLLTRLLRVYVRLFFGVRTRDANCPLRAYRKSALASLLDRLPEQPLVPNVYLTALAQHENLKVAPIEVEHRPRRGESVQGTMWGRRRSLFIPSRLLRFVARAGVESVRFARSLRRRGTGKRHLMIGVVLAGTAARFIVAARGHNWDFESYQIVGEIVTNGGNVYRDTSRYNYGPPWFLILGALHRLTVGAGFGLLAYRYAIVAFLTIVDIGIAGLLLARYGRIAAVVFFLNPVSIIITGYQSQFDNVAVLIGLIAVGLLVPRQDSPGITKKEAYGLALLGISLMVKHLLLLFPLWIALRKPDIRSRLIVASLPVGIFIVSFAPFWSSASQGIVDHVLKYQSYDNAPLLRLLLGSDVARSPALLTFGVFVIAAGFLMAALRIRIDDALLVYIILIVAVAPAIANQYAAIPMASISVMWNLPFAIYVIYGALYLTGDFDGMHYSWVPDLFARHDSRAYGVLCGLLVIGLGLELWRRSVAGSANSNPVSVAVETNP